MVIILLTGGTTYITPVPLSAEIICCTFSTGIEAMAFPLATLTEIPIGSLLTLFIIIKADEFGARETGNELYVVILLLVPLTIICKELLPPEYESKVI